MNARSITLLACLALLLCTPMPAVAQDDEEAKPDQTPRLEREALRQLRSAAQRLERDVRRLPEAEGARARSVEELARQLDARRKPDAVFDWIRANIRYEPYEGAVRGARGALISRRANDVDQALLARAIFEAAKIDTRFASGDVPNKAWETLGARTFGDIQVGSDDLKIAATLRGWDDLRPTEHIWLEVDHRGEFKAFDPILAERFGTAYNKSPNHSDVLPTQAEGSVRMSLHSRLDDGQQQQLLEHKGSLRALMGESITLTFEPDVARDRHVEPVLRVGDDETEGPRVPTDALARLELRFELEAGGRSYRMNKLLFVRGVTPEFFTHDQQVYSIGVLPGWVGAHWARDSVAAHLDDMAEAIDGWSQERLRDSDPQPDLRFRRDIDEFVRPLAATLPTLYALAADRATLSVADALQVMPVMSTPRIIVAGILRSGGDVSVDYWRGGGEIDAVGASALPRSLASGLAAIAGFEEEHRARELFAAITNDNSVGTEDVFNAARSSRLKFGTLHSRNTERISKLGVPDFYKSLLRERAVEDGKLILAPQKAASRAEEKLFAWWSIAPADDRLRAEAVATYAPANSAGADKRDVAIAGLLRAGMEVEDQLAELLDSSDVAAQVCEAASGAKRLSQAFCAESKLQSLPTLSECLAEAPGGSDLLGAAGSVTAGPGGPSRKKPQEHCNDESRRTRCGLVVADAVLRGELVFTDATETAKNDKTGADEVSEPASYCQ